MFIQTETTPNPKVIKFLPQLDRKTSWQSAEWKNSTDSSNPHHAAHPMNPMAQALFRLPAVQSIFVGADFVAVTKSEEFSWEQIKPDVLGTIMDFFSTTPIQEIDKTNELEGSPEESPEENQVVQKIKEIIATRIQPAVAQDGGDIQLAYFEKGVAYLNMRGACAGCPSSTITLKNGVENLLRYYVPELERVEAIEQFE